MTQEELLSRLKEKFPEAEKAAVEVKGYLTVKLPVRDLAAAARWFKTEGFDYLDMATVVDYSGPVSPKGYIMDPNPNAFLPEGAAPEVEAPAKAPNFPYRDVFEGVYCLSNLKERMKIFLKTEAPRSDPRFPSLYPVFKAADWQEREAFDLFGARYEGHPNLAKILTPDFIEGHPLRKDYVHKPDKFD